MTQPNTHSTLRTMALVAGTGLLAMTVCAVGAIAFVFEKHIVPGNAIATVGNILAGETQFRMGIAALLAVAILDVLVAWALYVFFAPANKNLSLLAAWFRLVYAAMLGVALSGYTHVLRLLETIHSTAAGEVTPLHADVMRSLRAFDDGWAMGLVFFGIHLLILGYLVFRCGYTPKVLGFALVIAGAAYVMDGFGRFLLPHHNLQLATWVGWMEALWMVWLLYKGLTGSPIRQARPEIIG